MTTMAAPTNTQPVIHLPEGWALCDHCGRPVTFGDYPFCPHGRYQQQFAIKQSTPSHAYYYRDPETNEIGIPADPELAPEGVKLERIDSIHEAEKLAREMSADSYRKFSDDGSFTATMDQALGNPRQTLIDQMAHPKSQMERDVLPLLVKELDDEADRRTQITTDTKFEFLGT